MLLLSSLLVWAEETVPTMDEEGQLSASKTTAFYPIMVASGERQRRMTSISLQEFGPARRA